MEEVDFTSDAFDDIVAKDQRYAPRAYALLMEAVRACKDGDDLLEEFKERTLDQYGPLSYRVLTEWGLACTEDIGEMMFNLAEANRIPREKSGTPEGYIGGYDFKEAFLGPYEV